MVSRGPATVSSLSSSSSKYRLLDSLPSPLSLSLNRAASVLSLTPSIQSPNLGRTVRWKTFPLFSTAIFSSLLVSFLRPCPPSLCIPTKFSASTHSCFFLRFSLSYNCSFTPSLPIPFILVLFSTPASSSSTSCSFSHFLFLSPSQFAILLHPNAITAFLLHQLHLFPFPSFLTLVICRSLPFNPNT